MKKKVKQTKEGTLIGTVVRHDTYYKVLPCRNRILTVLKALFTGKTRLEWQVPATRKDKRLRITGKRRC